VLRVSWAGPGFGKVEIAVDSLSTDNGQPMDLAGEATFTVDPAKAARGRELFAQYNCAACHQLGNAGKNGGGAGDVEGHGPRLYGETIPQARRISR